MKVNSQNHSTITAPYPSLLDRAQRSSLLYRLAAKDTMTSERNVGYYCNSGDLCASGAESRRASPDHLEIVCNARRLSVKQKLMSITTYFDTGTTETSESINYEAVSAGLTTGLAQNSKLVGHKTVNSAFYCFKHGCDFDLMPPGKCGNIEAFMDERDPLVKCVRFS